MKRDTARAIVLAAALMTLQALLLAVLASGGAHATTVYRCKAQHSEAVSYQSHACASGAGETVRAADARNAAQQSQARLNHAREMAMLDRDEPPGGIRAASKRRHKRGTASVPRQATAQAAVPLSSHRIGERPFERLGQQVSPPSKVQKRKRNRYDITARAPVEVKRGKPATKNDLTPSP